MKSFLKVGDKIEVVLQEGKGVQKIVDFKKLDINAF